MSESGDGYDWLRQAVAPKDHWKGWDHVFGPGAVLLGCGASVLANWVWGRMIGDVACSWRLAYSPRGPAFGIWSIIYLWTFLSILFQFLTNMAEDEWYCPDFGVNVLTAVAWVACSIWIWFFSLADSRNVRDGLGWAACCLVTAAGCMLAAVIWESSWTSQDSTRILTVGVPYSLFGGWLVLAASLSVGVFVASQQRPPDRCDDDGELLEVRVPEQWERFTPVAVAFASGTIAASLPDPILAVPLCWGVFWFPTGARLLPGIIALAALIVAVVRVLLV